MNVMRLNLEAAEHMVAKLAKKMQHTLTVVRGDEREALAKKLVVVEGCRCDLVTALEGDGDDAALKAVLHDVWVRIEELRKGQA